MTIRCANVHLAAGDDGGPPVRICAKAASAILEASARAHPLEACGLLLGQPDTILAMPEARNVAAEPRRAFEIDPRALFAAQRQARAGGPAVVGCWHSHPDGRARPSAADLAGAHALGWLWLIVAQGRVHGWRRTADGFQAIELEHFGA